MAHLVEHRLGIVVAMGSNPVQAWKTSIYLHISFFRFFHFAVDHAIVVLTIVVRSSWSKLPTHSDMSMINGEFSTVTSHPEIWDNKQSKLVVCIGLFQYAHLFFFVVVVVFKAFSFTIVSPLRTMV